MIVDEKRKKNGMRGQCGDCTFFFFFFFESSIFSHLLYFFGDMRGLGSLHLPIFFLFLGTQSQGLCISIQPFFLKVECSRVYPPSTISRAQSTFKTNKKHFQIPTPLFRFLLRASHFFKKKGKNAQYRGVYQRETLSHAQPDTFVEAQQADLH